MNEQYLVLSIETATLAGSLAISEGATILASCFGDPKLSHSNTLLADIDMLLAKAKVKLRDISLFAVASGPGSFTGLRIGIATVKALANTMNRACIGVPTLDATALAAGPSECTVALFPAGRGEVFSQMFSVSEEGRVTALDVPDHISPANALEKYAKEHNIIWAGPGTHIHLDLIRQTASMAGYQLFEVTGEIDRVSADGWKIAQPTQNLAQHVGSLALSEFSSKENHTPFELRAIYVRPSDAEMKV